VGNNVKSSNARPLHFREYNKASYRLAHWPIWIFVFFIAPGSLTFDLLERGLDARTALWLGVVLLGTGVAGLRGKLPGVEPQPYILRFTEDKPNPLYRRVCYTLAWSDLISFAVLNLAGLGYAVASGAWRLRQIYNAAYLPLAGMVLVCGLLGMLPRVKASTKGEGTERRYFYGSVWAVCAAAGFGDSVEAAAQVPRDRCREAGGVCRNPGRRGLSGPARSAAANRAYCGRRLGHFRLVAGNNMHLCGPRGAPRSRAATKDRL
jgi:hypothetical protein